INGSGGGDSGGRQGIPATGGGSTSSGGSTAGTTGGGGGASGGRAGGTGGAVQTGGSGVAGAGAGGTTAGTCSDAVLRTAPPAGKEAFKADPIDMKFPFSSHWMGVFSADPRFIGMTSFADFDHDGDLDFASGQREDVGGGVVWWEYCTPDHWVRHVVGTGHSSWAGGFAGDFDADGWMDIIAGDSWYRNPRAPRSMGWQRYNTGGPRPEEIIIGDVTGDHKPDALYLHASFKPQYWSPGTTPTATWTKGAELANNQQQGGAIGDIDGDGYNDILAGFRWWYRNVNGDGKTWQTVEIFPATAFDNAPLTYLGDLDGDGDTDFVMGTHFGARLAWAENMDGKGTQFTLHMLSTNKSFLHSIIAADFDNDGDLDLLAGQNVGPSFIFENTDGKGTFVEHRIAADTRSHDARVADVDCDGDLDIAGAPWGDQNEGGETVVPHPIRDHVYLQNMLVERGGKPLFVRHPYEVFPASEGRVCPNAPR
ncbi:MAG: VCBS repeat-containing protein, partial [Myxococcales bacterium]